MAYIATYAVSFKHDASCGGTGRWCSGEIPHECMQAAGEAGALRDRFLCSVAVHFGACFGNSPPGASVICYVPILWTLTVIVLCGYIGLRTSRFQELKQLIWIKFGQRKIWCPKECHRGASFTANGKWSSLAKILKWACENWEWVFMLQPSGIWWNSC